MKGRICIVCRKPKGVTFHTMEIDGQMRSIQAHVKCFILLRKRQTLTARLLDVFREKY